MEEFQGTTGPWQVVDTYHDYSEESGIIIWDGDEQASGPICDMGAIGDMNYGETLANANLIAASPELFECLNDFVKSVYTGCSKEELWALCRNSESVINKALGH